MLSLSFPRCSVPPLPFSLRAFDLDLQGLDLGLCNVSALVAVGSTDGGAPDIEFPAARGGGGGP